MKFYKQADCFQTHLPAYDGRCWETSIGCLLDIPATIIPFLTSTSDWYNRTKEFVAKYGYTLFRDVYDPKIELNLPIDYYIAVHNMSLNFSSCLFLHATIFKNGKLVWDTTSQIGYGLSKPIYYAWLER